MEESSRLEDMVAACCFKRIQAVRTHETKEEKDYIYKYSRFTVYPQVSRVEDMCSEI